ncbi:hypothetical protein [Arthrobacter sp. M4]|uniref:hypothetical protein n=1 Tax=Arthrobacter sp. M4 TaxID=218160 RepID=UPI001CDCEF42|nr:hypothetical protein [Arthrobacter sp. M4]MCA4134531.1 hypothetical protein [Arthrobacter sp. M4]
MSTISDAWLPYVRHTLAADTVELLQSGADFMHCGEPMHTIGGEVSSIQTPMSTETDPTDRSFDIYLQTRVLRCACGFQMEIPD